MMKRLILGMARKKQKALGKLDSLADTVDVHIIKCVVFKDSTHNLDHWCKELGTFMYTANNIKLKYNHNKPPSEKILYETIFEIFSKPEFV